MSLNFPSNQSSRSEPGSPEATGTEAGLSGQLLRLSTQADRLQAQLGRLAAEVQSSSDQVAALTRHLTDPSATQTLSEHLAELLARMETGQERLDELLQQVDGVNGTVTRLTRTQFKSNSLAEARDQRVASALDTLQDIVTRREEVNQTTVLQEQAHWAELRAEARGELAVDLLPALDGLELAMESGYALLERGHRQAADGADAAQAAPPPAGTWQRLRRVLLGQPEPAAPAYGIEQPVVADETLEALEGWLRGLELVRERFLGLLALEGIRPIEAHGRPFDPRLHVALQVEAHRDVPPGTVVAVLRKGYRQRERVLRYAEVAVSRLPEEGAQIASGPAASLEQAAGDEEVGERDPVVSEEKK